MRETPFQLNFGDCRTHLVGIESKSVDLILTDPPYNIGEYSTGNINLPGRTSLNNDIADWDKNIFDPSDVADEFIRVLKPDGNLFIFTSYNQIGQWHSLLNQKFDTFQFMVWHKTNPTPKIFKKGFLNSCELIICCWNKGNKWNFGKQNEMHNFFESSICMGNERLKEPKHPTQKPIAILKHIINIASAEGDLVLDPFMGVGSTGIAALECNRNFIGMELEKKYFEASNTRLTNWKNEH